MTKMPLESSKWLQYPQNFINDQNTLKTSKNYQNAHETSKKEKSKYS